MRLSQQEQRQFVKTPPVRTLAFGSHLHSQRLVKNYRAFKEKKWKILLILPYDACRLMGRVEWVEVIFVSKMCEANLKDEKQSVVSEKNASFHSQRVSVKEEEK